MCCWEGLEKERDILLASPGRRASAGPKGFKHTGFSKGGTNAQSGNAKFRELGKTLLSSWELMGREQGKGKKTP